MPDLFGMAIAIAGIYFLISKNKWSQRNFTLVQVPVVSAHSEVFGNLLDFKKSSKILKLMSNKLYFQRFIFDRKFVILR